MRAVPYDINEKLQNRIQTKATNADPKLSFWVSRKTTQLTDSVFLEASDVASGEITDCSIAARHTSFGFESDMVFIAYIQTGKVRVASSPVFTEISRHTWTDCGFEQSAEAVAVAFDGTMPKDTQGQYEFITEAVPWIFWISSGAVYGQKLGCSVQTLAAQNATDISAVRAMWSDVPGFDFGLVLFMVVNGAILYRQLIDGVWSDAEPITAYSLPAAKTWTRISAQRTWDYRVALQLLASDGSLYEVFTQFGGIGSKSAEHLAVKGVSADASLTKVNYMNAQEAGEHVEVWSIAADAPYGGLYNIGVPEIVEAYNSADFENNWGRLAVFVFSIYLREAEVENQFAQFGIVDSGGLTFTATGATLGADGKTVTLTFTNFNNARGECRATYTAGTVTSMAGTPLNKTDKSFTPSNLVPTAIPVPEVSEVTNI